MASRMARSERAKSSSARPSSESRRYSSMSRRTRFSISSLALTCAQMSPMVWSGVRTLARMRLMRVWSRCPPRMMRLNGMWIPSSKSSRASMARTRPPMSGMCEVVAEKATRRPPWKIGFARHTSLMCPVPSQGSLVMSTSPGRRSLPNSRRKCRTVAGRVPMKEGMLPEFWARAKPRASVRTQAKSLASFESVEKEVRTMALAASSTTEMMRVHSTSRVMGSKLAFTTMPPRQRWAASRRPQGQHEVATPGDAGTPTRADDQRGTLLLHHRGPVELVAHTEALAIVDGGGDEASALREVGGPRALERARRSLAGSALQNHVAARHGRAHGHADVEELHGHTRRGEGELVAIGGLEGGGEAPAARFALVVGSVGQRDDEVEALPHEAAVGEPAHAGVLELEAGVGHDRARLRHEEAEGGGDAGRGRADDARDTELLRHRPRVHRSRPARGEERVITRIAAALRDVHARGARHVLVHDVVNAPGDLDRLEADPSREPLHGGARRLQIDAHLPASEVRRIEIAEEEIRIGDGGLRAAQAIRGGPRVRSRTPRADLEQPDLVHVRDAPASRSDLDQLDRRDADGQATALDEAPLPCCLEAVGGERLAVVDQGELGGGAAHVEGEDAGGGAIAIVAAEEGGGDGARRGA